MRKPPARGAWGLRCPARVCAGRGGASSGGAGAGGGDPQAGDVAFGRHPEGGAVGFHSGGAQVGHSDLDGDLAIVEQVLLLLVLFDRVADTRTEEVLAPVERPGDAPEAQTDRQQAGDHHTGEGPASPEGVGSDPDVSSDMR